MRVGRCYRFRAHHSLLELGEPWSVDHSHLYTVEVEAAGDPPFAVDMERWDEIAKQFDAWEGANLDDAISPSTVENLAFFLLRDFPGAVAVTVWEDRDRWARAEH